MSSNGKPRSRRSGHTYYIDDVKVPMSITGVLNKGYPKPALVDAAAKESARYVLNRWDELQELEPSERFDRVLAARHEVWGAGKTRGTVIHKYAHRMAPPPFGEGADLEIPDEYIGHVDAYLKFVADWQPRELAVERPVYSRTHGYAGTPDLLAELVDGQVWLLDWKTTASGVWPENALQLAAARFAEYVVEPDGTEVPLADAFPPIEATGIVWLRADGYDLHPVEANEDAFDTFLAVLDVARYIGADRDEVIGDALLPPERTHADHPF